MQFWVKIPESTNQNIIPGFKGSLNVLQKGFNGVERLFRWIVVLFRHLLNNFGFRESHYKVSLLNLVVISDAYIHSPVKVKICQESKQVIL